MDYTFVRSTLSKDKLHTVPLRVTEMTYADAVEWHDRVQPFIRWVSGPKAREHFEVRADRTWDWPAMRQFFPLYMIAQGYFCQPLCIRTPTTDGTMALAGMVLVIDNYPYPRGDVVAEQPESAFAWFLTAAPVPALMKMNVPVMPSMGLPLVDVAVTTSLAAAHEGRTWLHAAKEGGEGLMKLYGKSCGMEAIPPTQVIAGRRKPDGRFFRMDEAAAAAFIAKTAPFR